MLSLLPPSGRRDRVLGMVRNDSSAGRYLSVAFSAPQSPIGIAENVYLDFDRTSPPAWQSPTPTLVAEGVDTTISNCNLRPVYRINRQDVMIEISNLNDQLRWERKCFYKTGLMSRLKRLFEASIDNEAPILCTSSDIDPQNTMQLPRFPQSKSEWKAALSTNSSDEKSSQWINKDLAPTPKAERTWSW